MTTMPRKPYGLDLEDMRRRAVFSALMNAGARLMAASGPSFKPQSSFSQLGQGLQGFGQDIQNQMGSGIQQAMLSTKVGELQRKAEQDKAFQAWLQGGQGSPQQVVGTPSGGGGPHGATLLSGPAGGEQGGIRQQAAMIAKIAGPEAARKWLAGRIGQQGKAPNVKPFKVGDKIVYKQWDGSRWVDMPGVGGPRYKPGTTVNLGGIHNYPLPKGAQTGAAKGVMDADQALARLTNIRNLWRPEFNTYTGRGKAYLNEIRDKLGMGADKKFLADYSVWKSQQQQYFIAYRKWATGVAGGEKEMGQIEASIPNITDSPTSYKAKLDALAKITSALRERHLSALKQGLAPGSPEYKKYLQNNPITPAFGGSARGVTRPNASALKKKYGLE